MLVRVWVVADRVERHFQPLLDDRGAEARA